MKAETTDQPILKSIQRLLSLLRMAKLEHKSGKTYSCFMELQGPDKIKIRGFLVILLMGRNYFWTRAE